MWLSKNMIWVIKKIIIDLLHDRFCGTKKIVLGNRTFVFVLKHKWDNKNQLKFLSEFKTYKLGIWFKRSKMVSIKDLDNPKKWKENTVNNYMIGFDLLVIKFWVSFDKNGMHF